MNLGYRPRVEGGRQAGSVEESPAGVRALVNRGPSAGAAPRTRRGDFNRGNSAREMTTRSGRGVGKEQAGGSPQNVCPSSGFRPDESLGTRQVR